MICETVPMEAAAGSLRYRYWLHRDVAAAGAEGLVFALLNPSTADAANDDPTIRRCIGFARQWGYRELTVVNLFALRATKPAELRRRGREAIGERNDEALRWARRHPATSLIVAAWGNHGAHLSRDAAAMAILAPALALRFTKRGCPAHPLYLPRSARPVARVPCGEAIAKQNGRGPHRRGTDQPQRPRRSSLATSPASAYGPPSTSGAGAQR